MCDVTSFPKVLQFKVTHELRYPKSLWTWKCSFALRLGDTLPSESYWKLFCKIGREAGGAWSQHYHVACGLFVETDFLILVKVVAQQPADLAIPWCLLWFDAGGQGTARQKAADFEQLIKPAVGKKAVWKAFKAQWE